MSEPAYPPPPPPHPSSAHVVGDFHGPGTNFFPGVRASLAALERPGLFAPKRGLLAALILGGSVSIVLAVVVQLALRVGGVTFAVIVAPFTEELFKALSVLIVALLIWKTIPNRRYGAGLGAAAGLGFGVVESTIYIIGFLASGATAGIIALSIVVRILVTPLMHPVWSALMGVGMFALLAGRTVKKPSPLWLAPMLLILGPIAHMMWNGFSTDLGDYEYLSVVLDIMVTFPLFATILRDFLGGHFNFRSFFEAPPAPLPSCPAMPYLPPPPPLDT
jgi:RsiW-degrading membrane proteinase PrsW (M82 family)